MAEPLPLILTDAQLEISTDGTEVGLTGLACLLSHIEITPDVQVTTIETMCGSRDYPGTVKWSLVASLFQSFDPDATEEVLSAAVALGTATPFRVTAYKSQPVSATNPQWTGMVIPQPYAPINGDAGDASTVDLEWAMEGEPVKAIVPDAAAAGIAAEPTRVRPGVVPTGAEPGEPGAFTPAGATVPASLGAVEGLGLQLGTAWPPGTFLTLGDGTEVHWNGEGWTAGRAA